jgi:hypothetical protein
MTYSTLKYYFAKCDKCGAELRKFFTDPDSVDNNAALYGWSKNGSKHLCKSCSVEIAISTRAVNVN